RGPARCHVTLREVSQTPTQISIASNTLNVSLIDGWLMMELSGGQMLLGTGQNKADDYQASVLSLMQFKTDQYGERAAFHIYEDGQWNGTTYSKLAEDVKRLSDYLIEQR